MRGGELRKSKMYFVRLNPRPLVPTAAMSALQLIVLQNSVAVGGQARPLFFACVLCGVDASAPTPDARPTQGKQLRPAVARGQGT